MKYRHRIVTAPQSFDVELFRGLDRVGEPVWEKLAYFRSRAALDGYLQRKGLAHLVDGLPERHPDVAAAANRHVVSLIESELAAVANGERARERLRATRPACQDGR